MAVETQIVICIKTVYQSTTNFLKKVGDNKIFYSMCQGFLQLDDIRGQHDPHMRITRDPHEILEGHTIHNLQMKVKTCVMNVYYIHTHERDIQRETDRQTDRQTDMPTPKMCFHLEPSLYWSIFSSSEHFQKYRKK